MSIKVDDSDRVFNNFYIPRREFLIKRFQFTKNAKLKKLYALGFS